MENLFLLGVEQTNLYLLVNGKNELLIQNSEMNMSLVQLHDPKDIQTFGVQALCFFTWPADGMMFSLPLLSGMRVIRKDSGFLIMMEMNRIYFLEFTDSVTEMQIIIEKHIGEFTPLLAPPCGIPLRDQLEYIYGATMEIEQGDDDFLHEGSENASGYVKFLDGVGNVLVFGSEIAQAGIVKLAGYTAKGIQYGKEKYIESTDKKGDYDVDEKVQKGLEIVSSAAGVAATVSKKVVEATAEILVSGGHVVVKKLKERQEKSNSKPSEELKATGRFLIKSLESFENVTTGLMDGAGILVENVSVSAVAVAQHRYGEQVGKATESGMKALTSTAGAAKHLSHFSHPTKFALAVGKTSGDLLKSGDGSSSPNASTNSLSSSSIVANPSLTLLPTVPTPSISSSSPSFSSPSSPSFSSSAFPSSSNSSSAPPLYQEALPESEDAPPPYQAIESNQH